MVKQIQPVQIPAPELRFYTMALTFPWRLKPYTQFLSSIINNLYKNIYRPFPNSIVWLVVASITTSNLDVSNTHLANKIEFWVYRNAKDAKNIVLVIINYQPYTLKNGL